MGSGPALSVVPRSGVQRDWNLWSNAPPIISHKCPIPFTSHFMCVQTFHMVNIDVPCSWCWCSLTWHNFQSILLMHPKCFTEVSPKCFTEVTEAFQEASHWENRSCLQKHYVIVIAWVQGLDRMYCLLIPSLAHWISPGCVWRSCFSRVWRRMWRLAYLYQSGCLCDCWENCPDH